MALSIFSATSGLERTNLRKFSRERTAKKASSMTVVSAERGLPSKSAISPKKSPPANSASVTSLPSASRMLMRTRPRSIRYIESPVSPRRNSVVPPGTSRSSSRLRKSLAALSSSDANSGTDRNSSSVITRETFVDISSPQEEG
jgi:hypothetical protein